MRTLFSIFIALSITLFAVTGCQTPPELPPLQEQTIPDTSYVQLFPPFFGFTNPQDILIGNDQLLYVADTDSNRLVMMNRAGQVMSSRRMLHPLSVAQDSRLDLLVGGEVIAANGDTVGALFRVALVSGNPVTTHRLEFSRVDTIWQERAKPRRRFPGITVFGDNSYLVVRTGPDNSSFVDPDARVLFFDKNDVFITPVPAFTSTAGGSITNINKPTSIASFPGVRDFVLAQSSEGVAYGGVWMIYESTSDFEGWLLRYDPARIDDRGIDFIKAGRFLQPEAVTIDPGRRDVFIADAGLDSIFKFNNRGRLRSESFGFYRSEGTMKRPTGLAFFEQVLYIAEAEDGMILRFRLSTDVPR